MANARSLRDATPSEKAEQLLEDGAFEEAAGLLRPLIEGGCGGLFARLQFVRALSGSQAVDEALRAARETALLFPNAAAAALGLGEALSQAGHLPTAIAEFQRALRIDPHLKDARYLLGKAWLEAGEPEKALQELQAVADSDRPDRDVLIFQAEEMRGAARSNARYVRHLFDQFSEDYDSRMLGPLAYSAPRILRELADLVAASTAEHTLDILDMGCGTGLAAVAFADLAHRIDGIDLSPAMLEKARSRDLYSDLMVGDIEVLGYDNMFDLVIAADTLVYLGDLGPVFSSVRRGLRPDGQFLFTVEKGDDERFVLGPKRRWRHSASYLREVAEICGLDMIAMLDCTPRTEAGMPVNGLAVAVRKPL